MLYIYEVYIINSSTVGATNRKMKHYGYKYKKNGLTCSVDDLFLGEERIKRRVMSYYACERMPGYIAD